MLRILGAVDVFEEVDTKADCLHNRASAAHQAHEPPPDGAFLYCDRIEVAFQLGIRGVTALADVGEGEQPDLEVFDE